MATAKDLIVKQISAGDANALIKRVHYSGKVVQNSQIHLGVFLNDRLEGALQFGPSLDKRKIQGLVEGTLWHEFIELNRMAFTDRLPRNSESRAIAVAMRLLRKFAPQLKWVVSFADATQCGDGTIYRASGFVLTGIKENTQSYKIPSGDKIRECGYFDGNDYRWRALADYADNFCSIHTMFIQGGTRNSEQQIAIRDLYRSLLNGKQSMSDFMLLIGGAPFDGFQLRYIYFLDPSYRARLTVPEIPFSEIEKRGAAMYKGQPITRGRSADSGTPGDQPGGGGASPTRPLLASEVTQ